MIIHQIIIYQFFEGIWENPTIDANVAKVILRDFPFKTRNCTFLRVGVIFHDLCYMVDSIRSQDSEGFFYPKRQEQSKKLKQLATARATHGCWFLGAWRRCYDVMFFGFLWRFQYGMWLWIIDLVWQKNTMMIGYYIIDLDHQFTTPDWILQPLLNRFHYQWNLKDVGSKAFPLPKTAGRGQLFSDLWIVVFPKANQTTLSTKHKTQNTRHKHKKKQPWLIP